MLSVIHCPESSTQTTISHWFSARPAHAIRVQRDMGFVLDDGSERRALGYGRPHAPYYAHRLDQIVCWQREFSPLQNQACQGYIGRIGYCHFPTLIAYAMCRPYSLKAGWGMSNTPSTGPVACVLRHVGAIRQANSQLPKLSTNPRLGCSVYDISSGEHWLQPTPPQQ
jgi:hypothetical protein